MRFVHKNRTGQPWVKPGHDDLFQTPRGKPRGVFAFPPAA
jgi:hypothetical protein